MVYCMGHQCTIKNTCKRYTHGLNVTVSDGCDEKFMRKCTLRKRYVQDETKINEDSKKHRLCLK